MMRWLPLSAITWCGVAAAAIDPGIPEAPRMEFAAPLPGTYTLQRIQPVQDGPLLDVRSRKVRMSQLTRGKITLLTFFYTYCMDPLGCPLAHTTLAQLRDRVLERESLAKRVRFVSISLDPTHDTPRELASYATALASPPGFDWQFVTAQHTQDLLPMLNDLGQDVSVETDSAGRPTRTLHHMLKLFLIDAQGFVREIYTLSFLQPQVMFNDMLTLASEAPAA